LPAPLISCLTVTQPGRAAQLAGSLHCFSRQTWSPRELVVVHDGDDAFHVEVQNLLQTVEGGAIRVARADVGTPLGTLRNLAVESARGELVCQWDDDDLYHPERLSRQYRHLEAADADFCFLTDQLHWFRNTGEFFWDDWNAEVFPMNLIQGTLLGYRDAMPAYPPLSRGEDTPVMRTLQAAGERLAGLGGHGWLYVYVYHGSNAWDLGHHGAISGWKRLRAGQLEARRDELRRRLRELGLPLSGARFTHDSGEMWVDLGTGMPDPDPINRETGGR